MTEPTKLCSCREAHSTNGALLVLNLLVMVSIWYALPGTHFFKQQTLYWANTMIAQRREEVAAMNSLSGTLNIFMAQSNDKNRSIKADLDVLMARGCQ